jgi:hypothetical protein
MLEEKELEQLPCVRDVLAEFKKVLDSCLYETIKKTYLRSLLASLERDGVTDKKAILMFSGKGKRANQLLLKEETTKHVRKRLAED